MCTYILCTLRPLKRIIVQHSPKKCRNAAMPRSDESNESDAVLLMGGWAYTWEGAHNISGGAG